MSPQSGAPHAPPYVAGIDGGTEALKVGIFDLSGHLVASASASYPTHFPQSGWAEQDPEDWWRALGDASRRCFAAAAIDPKDVVAISADGTTCTLLPLDAHNRPLRRAFLWMDVRAAQQAQRITDTGHPALKYSPSGVSAEWMPPKTLWLKEHQPDIYHQTRTLLEYTDWLALRLTGRRTLNLCTATQRWFYDRPNGGWPAGFFDAIGLGDVHSKLPSDVLPLGAHLGDVTAEASAHTGFASGTRIYAGGCDAAVGTLALNVVQPGQLALVTGSSNVLMGFTDQPLHIPGLMGSFPDAVISDLELIEAGQVSTGSVVAWFRREFAADLMRDHPNDSAAIYRILDQDAAQISPGSGGVVVLETFQGNRSPYADALARGAIWGLSLATTRAHVYRALLEGIAYGTAHILDVLAGHGYCPSGLTASGGATRSRFFLQLYADVIGLPIRTTETTEASLLGSAIAAATGAGLYPSFAAASAGMVRTAETFAPDPVTHQRYTFWVDKYARTYAQLRPLMQEIAALGHAPVS
jgi:FGGY-family pentulose kinase